jgi:hypothetical protein
MGLIPKLKQAMAEQSCGRNTTETYCWWARKLYAHTCKPASQWTGADVQDWLWSLHQARYSALSPSLTLLPSVHNFLP